jgi:hypothetical protein
MNKSVLITRDFVLLNAIIWLAFSIIVATGMHPALPDSAFYKWFLAISAFLSAVFLFLLFFLLNKKTKIAYILTIAFLTLIVLLTIMDDLGIIDLIVLLITITPIILLIKGRKWYLLNQ